jgi:hypothetical protein
MATDPNSAEDTKKPNYILWGCLIVIILGCLMSGCLMTLVGLPLFTDFDPLGLDIQDWMDDILNFEDYLEEPDLDGIFPDDENSSYEVPDTEPIEPVPFSGTMPLVPYSAVDFRANFSYPVDWEITEEDFRVTFSQPDTYTFLEVGEITVDEGAPAAVVAEDFLATIKENAAEGTFELLESGPYLLDAGYDAYLNAFQFVDNNGYFYWVYDLEIVDGESNIFFYLEGENPEEFEVYRAIFDEIAASFYR